MPGAELTHFLGSFWPAELEIKGDGFCLRIYMHSKVKNLSKSVGGGMLLCDKGVSYVLLQHGNVNTDGLRDE